MLRTALVDVGGTLWPELGPPTDRQERRLQDEVGLDGLQTSQVVHALNRAISTWESPTVLEQDTDGLIRKVLGRLHIKGVDERSVREAMCVPASDGATLFSEAPQLLRDIAGLGLRTILVSNTAWRDTNVYRRDFDYFGMSEHIDTIITSLEVGFRKPHSAIFRAALDAAQCSPSDCVFLGDSEEKDIRPAFRQGMRSILVAIERPAPRHSVADAVATSLSQVT